MQVPLALLPLVPLFMPQEYISGEEAEEVWIAVWIVVWIERRIERRIDMWIRHVD